MTLLNKVMTNTIHFSDSVRPVSTQSRHKWYGILILLLYLAVQLDLCTVTDWNRRYLQCSQYNLKTYKEDSLIVSFVMLTTKLFSKVAGVGLFNP